MSGHDVTLEWPDGRSETVEVGPQETVLEAALRERIRLPYDCRKGTCTACVGRVRSVGEDHDGSDESPDAANAVDYRRPPRALEESDRADGYALLCIAHPRADCRIEVGPMVRSQLGDSPWG
ncbi:ferredoxin [Natronococcus amylolyticus DSM 10524]|uniref:Ferredoxin n=1 Tax=Natronococcus amylolyticus DSM 10524 TaxID=1227497 RepID=L9XAW7_9EURY|nr:2Fe-2S iron-sulfur cluster-binding protein [Natronococcus amylolyticus]ELY58787.1 ferredoxin [Natronococcus amylolyticus DSM 10524]